MSGTERVYLRRRVGRMEAKASALTMRALVAARPEAVVLLARAERHRARAHRLERYLDTAGR